MRQKLGTSIRTNLLREAKRQAARSGKPLNQLLEEALEEHLRAAKEHKEILGLGQVLTAHGGEFADLAQGGAGSGDFDAGDFD